MPAILTQQDGIVSAAFNVERGHPWHRLGKQVHKDMTIETALALSGSDDTVQPVVLHALNPETGAYDPVDSHVGIWSDKYGTISVASPSYDITQRSEILELAYEVKGLSKTEAHIDCIGNIGESANKFFAYIRVPDLVIDPQGVADTVEQGLFVATSFDGTLPNIIGHSAIRVVCNNTLQMALKGTREFIKARHTLNSEDRMKQAAVALGWAGAVEEAMVAKATSLLAVKDGDKALTKALDYIWPLEDDLPESTRTRRLGERGTVRMIYEGDSNLNVDKVGRNGWAAYNAVVEFLDHNRNVRGVNGETDAQAVRRAEASVLPGSLAKKKAQVADLILA